MYHVRPLEASLQNTKKFVNNDREYVIHLNMRQNTKETDQIKAFFMARLLDESLKKGDTIEQATMKAE